MSAEAAAEAATAEKATVESPADALVDGDVLLDAYALDDADADVADAAFIYKSPKDIYQQASKEGGFLIMDAENRNRVSIEMMDMDE